MEKIDTSTPDLTRENIEKIAALFPDVVTETVDEDGELRHVIDFDALRDDLSSDIVDGPRERYQFTWPGKRAAKAEARAPFDGTLRPCPEKSKDWDTTQNVYIEGDNLQALKLMRETYAGQVKLIYIDPPYNTGHDFVYDDDFARTREDYDTENGELDEEGGRLVANPESNGRFHSDWCSMIYPRLLLARDLLSDDGAIFISIDDNESMNLRKICDEVFGAENFLACFVWQKTLTRRNDAKKISSAHEYLMAYTKAYDAISVLPEEPGEKQRMTYSNRDNDSRGDWLAVPFHAPNIRPNLTYPITLPSGRTVMPPKGRCWSTSRENFDLLVADNRIWFGRDGDGMPQRKKFWSERRADEGVVPWTWWPYTEAGENREATKEIKELFDDATMFTAPKPTKLLNKVFQLVDISDALIVDFFSGSGTTAEALMKYCANARMRAKWILVQMPEICAEGSVPLESGYRTICDIGEERIRRAGEKIRAEVEEANRQAKIGEEPKRVPDVGFRVFKVDSSNFQDVRRQPDQLGQQQLSLFTDNVKPDRTPEDLLFQVLPKFRIPYSAKIQERDICGKTVFDVNGGQLMACFDVEVGNDTIEAIAKERPLYAVFRDASMADDATEANFEELFKTYSPDTIRRVI
jgi:adenine-specific DNA-methyltransferase